MNTDSPSVDDRLSVWPVHGIPEVETGADLAGLLVRGLDASGLTLADGDVLVVTSKIVSKAHGLRVPGGQSRRDIVRQEAVRVVAERATSTGPTQIVEGRTGIVSAAAGVDASNTGPSGEVLLLPERPDEAAAHLHADVLRRVRGVRHLGIILSDTAGRPWRGGQTDFALGAHGLRVIDDYRGRVDADGRDLAVTAMAVADELAAAADLVKRKARGVPAALIRGANSWVIPADDEDARSRWREGAARLIRTGPGDWFALGHVEAVRAALGHPPGSASSREIGIPSVGDEPVQVRLARAVALAVADSSGSVHGVETIADPTDSMVTIRVAGPAGSTDSAGLTDSAGPPDSYVLGRLAARLEVALWSEDLRGTIERIPVGLIVTARAGDTTGA